MQRFFFDFDDGPPDDAGVDLPSLETAEADARASLLLSAAHNGVAHAGVMVRDETGQRLAEITLSVATRRGDAA